MALTPVVEWDDIEFSTPGTTTVTTTEGELLPSRLGKKPRSALYIQNTSTTTLTITLGDSPATADVGYRLTQNQALNMSEDAGSKVWQGAVRAVASASSTVVYNEVIKQ